MGPQNQAFGLICGYEHNVPVCCRVDRPVGADTKKLYKARLTTVQVIGHSDHCKAAQAHAENAISQGTDPKQALYDAVQSRLSGKYVRGPVEHLTIKRAEHPPGADGGKIAVLRKGRASLEFIWAAAQAGR